MKTVKIISGILLAIAYISLTVVGFMNGLQKRTENNGLSIAHCLGSGLAYFLHFQSR